ncbi:PGF-pre-PGF domain-containing protein [Candidatus Pacearchaeota archaeon]|nr:PGF-pre-PGF domain-containing protein [Candidatus Pacearchaeota archaeon]
MTITRFNINYIVIFIVLFLIVSDVQAIPVPHGIDGTIYELDGITRVRDGIDFYVKNLNNQDTISGKTSHSNPGSYSVAISGNDGDIIIVKAWNKYNQANETFTLTGVMYGINLRLNMTYPPIPPIITSDPITQAIEGKPYVYEVSAYDENDDSLKYSLIKKPDGMMINETTGKVTWLPMQSHVGANNIVIQVSDDIFTVNQSFIIEVENVNDAPVINTTPILNAKVGKVYIYDVDAINDDNDNLKYSLVLSPKEMSIDNETGLINWKPKGNDKGNNNVIVQVSDGTLTDTQEFNILVYASENKKDKDQQSNGNKRTSTGGGGGGSINTPLSKLMQDEKTSGIIIRTNLKDIILKVEELNERPKDTKSISKVVYKYIRIENINQSYIGEAEINFSVNLGWLNKNDINISQIVLSRYTADGWEDLVTENVSIKGDYVYYTSKSPGFSYFAITVREGVKVKNIIEPVISSIKSPFRISGIFYKFGKFRQIDIGTEYSIKNLNTSKIFYGKTGIGLNSGAYYTLLYGNKGDILKINLKNIEKEFYSELKDSKDLDFMLNLKHNSIFTIILSISGLIILFSLIIFKKFKYKKK